MLRQWTRPRFDLGNHFYSHPDVNGLGVSEIEQEIASGETFGSLLKDVHRQATIRYSTSSDLVSWSAPEQLPGMIPSTWAYEPSWFSTRQCGRRRQA
jgi:peptidoglycan/xylan/chitin deacetylase (PgdA/CDA1 family)